MQTKTDTKIVVVPNTTVFSPGAVLSPPALASTPSTDINRSTRFYGQYTGSDNGTRNKTVKSRHLDYDLTELPVVVLDKVFAVLSDQDLRAFHQVSYAWKTCLESRNGDNSRRLQLVRRIRENKENILNGSKGQQVSDNNRINRRADLKPESQQLIECTNNVHNISDANSSKDTTTGNLLTPNSRFPFQSFEECERGLKKGQKLFQCRRCKGPVPSPILPGAGSDDEEYEENAGCKKIAATRCRLTSRMGLITPENTKKLPDRKKTKTASLMLPPMSPIIPLDVPTTRTLGEMMSKSLFISNREASPSGNIQDIGQSLPHAKETASATGIDLNSNRISDIDFITYKLNLTNSSPNSFGMLREPDSPMSAMNPELTDSAISAFSVSVDSFVLSESSLFPNLIMSPDLKIIQPESTLGATAKLKQDFMKSITLNSSTDGSYSQIYLDIDKPEQKANDIELSTYECHSKYDINSMHDKSLIITGDRESKNGPNVDLNLNPSHAFNGLQNSKFSVDTGTSDYFSLGSNELRDGCSSYIPEMSPSKSDFYHRTEDESTSNNNIKSRSRSLGNMIDSSSREISFQSYESSTSLPNLNESFILECPNPSCSFRFCSSCGDAEHPNKMCHIIDSESFEALNMSSDILQCKKLSQNNLNAGENGRKGKGQSVPIKGVKSSKEKLRRLARL